MTNGKKDILIITGRYLPGYKDGGPVRTIKNLTDFLGLEYNFRILTCDRDHGDKKPYMDICVNNWNFVGNAQVYYVAPGEFKKDLIAHLAETVDLVYVCGCFSDYSINTLILNWIGKIKVPVVVAAMGLFSPMEFHLKYIKKKSFIMLFNFLGIFKKIYWSATSEIEIDEIRKQVWVDRKNFYIAEDLPRKVSEELIKKHKEDKCLEIVWISRIAPKKNLKGAISILQKVKTCVNFTIYGPIHVKEYWNECLEELKKLPDNVRWEYEGNVDSENVVDTLKKHHIFLFPTLGENYGHVIQEALSAGCPCIISDQTPWKDLEQNNSGYVFSLKDTDAYVDAIERYAAMTEKDFSKCVFDAHRYAIQNSNNKVNNTGYRMIFDTCK
ncbi:MAG: glycosyltransferase family 4 protein [Lachnospiraceae bacterium]|nr:glycosyltransferase family 4 protein [Lachnospiraceae bacterium]